MKFIKFHGIPWNFKISFKISFQCSLKLILIKKFHGTFSRVPWNFLNNIWTTPVVPWNSMELEQQNLKFHGIPCNSTEFCPDPKFHGIPWNFFHTPEFHGIPWNSMASNHQSHDCLLNRLFRRRSKKTSKFLVTGLCAGNSPETGEFPPQMASNAESVSIWWRHNDIIHRITIYNKLFITGSNAVKNGVGRGICVALFPWNMIDPIHLHFDLTAMRIYYLILYF